jgi:hypothetical protein
VHIRGTSVLLAAIIVGVAMAGAWWLQYYRQFPWVVFFGVFFPAQWIVVMAAGGPHEVSGETWVDVATFLLAILMWYALIEGARFWWQHRTKRDLSAHSEA